MARVDWRKYGLEPLGGSARGFRDVETGAYVPRRQAENRREEIDETGYATWSERQYYTGRTTQGKRVRLFRAFVDMKMREEGVTRRQAERDPELVENAIALSKMNRRERIQDRERPRGRLAKTLVATGVRPEGARYAPGQTPVRRGRKR